MEPKDYTVVKIEGEYAYLRADGETQAEDLFIAMALLPLALIICTRNISADIPNISVTP